MRRFAARIAGVPSPTLIGDAAVAAQVKECSAMQGYSGLILMVAGVALAGLQLLPEPIDGAAQLSEVTRISAAPDRAPQTDTSQSNSRSFATPALSSASFRERSQPRPQPAAKPAHAWTAVVIADPASPAFKPITSSKPGDAMTRAELARDLQRELTRVGCYGGEINGGWTTSTRRAMAAFNERVNATLPITEPDYILLSLVQGQSGLVCSAECPEGQVKADYGRCVPHAVVAQASRKANREDQRRRDADARQAEEARLMAEGRTSDEARQIADARRVMDSRKSAEAKRIAERNRLAGLDQGWTATTAPSPTREELPWMQEPRAIAAADTPPSAEPLPGRMSIGAAPFELPKGLGVATPNGTGAPLAGVAAASETGGPAMIVAPVPRPAVRPSPATSELDRVAALDDPSDVDAVLPTPPVLDPSLRASKILKRPAAAIAARAKRKYAYEGGKARRGLPRPGSMPYLQQQALGGFY
ncbi:MAG: hypothetical protein ACKVP4_04460 [Hyphomicrobium sp.]